MYANPGSPIKSQPDISEASADKAVIQGPICLPPRKKSEEELFFLAYLKPMKIINPRYKTNAIIFAISSPDTVSSKTLRILINFNHYKQNMKLCNHLSY